MIWMIHGYVNYPQLYWSHQKQTFLQFSFLLPILLLFNSFTFQYERYFPGILFWYTLIYKFCRFKGRILSFILDVCPLMNNPICFKSRVVSFVLHICPLINTPICFKGRLLSFILYICPFINYLVCFKSRILSFILDICKAPKINQFRF